MGWVLRILLVMGIGAALIGGTAAYVFHRTVNDMADTFMDSLGRAAGSAVGTEAQISGPTEVRVLQQVGFDPGADGAAVILHPAFTGGAHPMLIDDPALLSDATDRVFFTDDRGAETRMVLLSILFLSPPGNGSRATMASLFQDGREVATFTCYVGQCPRAGPPTSPHDLAGLANAGRAPEFATEKVHGLAQARAPEQEILSRPGHLLTTDLAEQMGPAARFDGYVWIDLPSSFGPFDPDASIRGATENDTFQAASRSLAAGLPVEIEVDRSSVGREWSGYQIIDTATDRQAMAQDGYLLMDAFLPQFTPHARFWVDAAYADALRTAIATAAWPEPRPRPTDKSMAARLPQVIAENGLAGPPEQYRHHATVFDMRDAIATSEFTAPRFFLSYDRPLQ